MKGIKDRKSKKGRCRRKKKRKICWRKVVSRNGRTKTLILINNLNLIMKIKMIVKMIEFK